MPARGLNAMWVADSSAGSLGALASNASCSASSRPPSVILTVAPAWSA
jgi:hypothetical protein